MRSHDFDEIAALLHIGRQAHEFGNLQNIASAAAARLKQINEEMQPDGLGGPSPTVAEEASAESETGEDNASPPPPNAPSVPRR
jgi:hypothetical protein